MKNYIEDLKKVEGGGNLKEAQKILEEYGLVIKFNNLKSIEEIDKFANNMIDKICERLTKKNQNEELNLKDLMFFEKLSDACYCIIWTKKHQPRTITETI